MKNPFAQEQCLGTIVIRSAALLAVLACSAAAQAQTTVFLETFGNDSARASSPYVPRSRPTDNPGYYTPQLTGPVPDGTYTIMRPQNVTGIAVYWANLAQDHTDQAAGAGGTTGALMVLNAGSSPDQFYRRNFDVEAGHSYRVSVWRYVVNGDFTSPPYSSTSPGPIAWSLQVQNVNSGTVLLESPDIVSSASRTWEESRYEFTVPPNCATLPGGTQASLSLRNRSAVIEGNDFYIDDISVTRLPYDPTLPGSCPTEHSAVTAGDDTASTTAGTAIDIPVNVNDTNTRPATTLGAPRVVKPPANGTVAVNPNGTLRYTPPAGFAGTATFDYEICNNQTPDVECDIATVTVYVDPVPDIAINLSGLPSTGATGVPYAGTFTCVNVGTASATAGTSCAVGSLPSGVTQGACSISPAGAPWPAGGPIAQGQTVTCAVNGTPTSSGTSIAAGSTGATGDTNAANNTAQRPIVVAAAPVLSINLALLPTTGTVGVPYSGSFSCTNSGTASADPGTCSVSNLPVGLTPGACTITPGNAPWSAGNAIPVGQTVTCQVAGTPTTPGVSPTTGSYGGAPVAHPITVAGVPNVLIDLGNVPAAGTVGTPYIGSFSCTNNGSADAASASCTVSNLPAGVTQGACTLGPAGAPWTSPAAIPVGATVTCPLSGTPTTAGLSRVSGQAAADGITASATQDVTIGLAVPVPTLGQWAQILMAAWLAVWGMIAARRQRGGVQR